MFTLTSQHSTPDPETLKPRELRRQRSLFNSLGGVARVKVTPSSIPNLEVKLLIADNTAGYAGGNVGRRRLETFLYLLLIFNQNTFPNYHILFIATLIFNYNYFIIF